MQGHRRGYALLLGREGKIRLIKLLDGDSVLAEQDFDVRFGQTYTLQLQVHSARISAWVDDKPIFAITDTDSPLLCGGIGLVCTAGRFGVNRVTVKPV